MRIIIKVFCFFINSFSLNIINFSLFDLVFGRGFPDSSVGKESACNADLIPGFDSWVEKIHWRRDRLPTAVFLGFPVAQLVKNLPAMCET